HCFNRSACTDRCRTGARKSQETCFNRISGGHCRRSISMARKRRRACRESLVGHAESADQAISRSVAGPSGNRKAINGVVRKNFARLLLACLAARAVVRDEIPAAKATAVTGYAHVG